jgi:hypothetical protein
MDWRGQRQGRDVDRTDSPGSARSAPDRPASSC